MTKAQALGSVFKELFQELGIDHSIEQNTALLVWDEVVGERVWH